jgi:hypothetical protein
MRLYEFTDSNKYIPRSTGVAKPPKCLGRIRPRDMLDEAVPHPRPNPQIKRTNLLDTP